MLAPACEIHTHYPADPKFAPFADLCFASRDLYPTFAADLRMETGTDIELCLAGHSSTDWREPGITFATRHLPDPVLERLLPLGEPTEWADYPAVTLPLEGQVESRKLVEALRKAAESAGVKIVENAIVRRVVRDSRGRVTALASETDNYPCGGALLCAGAWSGKMSGLPENVSVPVKPMAGQIVSLRGERRLGRVIYSDGCYLVPRRDGRLLVGATVEDAGFNKRVSAGSIAKLLEAAFILLPELREAPFESSWTGLRPTTPDNMPILSATPAPNLWIATGHGRNGILLAPITGQIVAAAVLSGGPLPAPFAASRFTQPAAAPNGRPNSSSTNASTLNGHEVHTAQRGKSLDRFGDSAKPASGT